MKTSPLASCLLLVACAGTEPAVTPPPSISSVAPVASPSPAPAASSAPPPAASSAPPLAVVEVPYHPLPRVTSCAACAWPGTGCSEANPKECALDPLAWWEVQIQRVKPAGKAGEGEEVCVGAQDRSTCGKTGKKRKNGWILLEPGQEPRARTVLSTEELVGLQPPTLSAMGRGTPAVVVPTFKVNAALFKDGFAMRHADGDEAWLTIRPGKAPAELPPAERVRGPLPGESTTATTKAKAKSFAKKVLDIDAKLASLHRKTALTHRKSGFEIRLIAFYDGKDLVRVYAEFPYLPPMVDTVYYFEKGKLLAEHTVVTGSDEQGNPKIEVTTSFYDETGLFWSSDPGFDPKKTGPAPTPVSTNLAAEIERAVKDPSYYVTEGSLLGLFGCSWRKSWPSAAGGGFVGGERPP